MPHQSNRSQMQTFPCRCKYWCKSDPIFSKMKVFRKNVKAFDQANNYRHTKGKMEKQKHQLIIYIRIYDYMPTLCPLESPVKIRDAELIERHVCRFWGTGMVFSRTSLQKNFRAIKQRFSSNNRLDQRKHSGKPNVLASNATFELSLRSVTEFLLQSGSFSLLHFSDICCSPL